MPYGVIFDHAGRPITDPGAVLKGGLLAPLGTPHAPHKGFGLALFIDAVSGVLSGAGFAQGVADGAPGNFLWALDVEAFLPQQEFLKRMDAQLDQIKQGERLPGVQELLLPGERGQRRYLDLTARGVVALAKNKSIRTDLPRPTSPCMYRPLGGSAPLPPKLRPKSPRPRGR